MRSVVHGVSVVHADVLVPPGRRHVASSWLPATDLDRMATFRRPADQDGFLAARVLARLLLSEATDGRPPASWSIAQSCPSCDRPHGRPRVVTGEAQVSWAHTGALVAAAVSSAAVGVDVERVTPTPPPLPDATGSGLTAWLRWTRMEALVKRGDGDLDAGLPWPLDGPAAPDGRPVRDYLPHHPCRGVLTDVVAGDGAWVASVATDAPADVVPVRRLLARFSG